MQSMDRPLPRRRLPRFAAFALAGAAGALAVASPAWAAPGAPENLGVTPASPMQSHTPSISWTAGTADPGESIVGYQGGFAAGAADAIAAPVAPTLGDGAYTFSVRAVQSDGQVSAYAALPIVVDNGAPTITFGFSSPGERGRLASRAVDDHAELRRRPRRDRHVHAALHRPMDDRQRHGQRRCDGHGHRWGTREVGSQSFKYDDTAPATTEPAPPGPPRPAGQPTQPGRASRRGADLQLDAGLRRDLRTSTATSCSSATPNGDNDWHTIANRDDTGGVGDYSAQRDPSVWRTPLPERHQLAVARRDVRQRRQLARLDRALR